MKRTPSLTKNCRDMFEAELLNGGWQPGGTIKRISMRTGLSVDQVRDAIFGPTADAWRISLSERVREARHSSG
jgi:hypothetical protein